MYYNAITVALIAVVLSLVFNLAKKEADKKGTEMSTTYFTVTLPKVYFWLCVIFTALFGIVLVLTTLFMFIDAKFSYLPLLLFFAVFFAGLIWCCSAITRWKIQVADDNILVTTFTGKVKQHNVQELEAKQKAQTLEAKVYGKRLFAIDFSHVGYDYMLNWLRMYQKIQ